MRRVNLLTTQEKNGWIPSPLLASPLKTNLSQALKSAEQIAEADEKEVALCKNGLGKAMRFFFFFFLARRDLEAPMEKNPLKRM